MAAPTTSGPTALPTLEALVYRSVKRGRDLFPEDPAGSAPAAEEDAVGAAAKMRLAVKLRAEYAAVTAARASNRGGPAGSGGAGAPRGGAGGAPLMLEGAKTSKVLALTTGGPSGDGPSAAAAATPQPQPQSKAMVLRDPGASEATRVLAMRAPSMPKPAWHPQWKLMRVISGHQGWVRAVAVEPGNEWFVTGSADRTLKIWDLASGTLKLSLTGHISTIRGVAVSERHPYLFSCGEDKMVKCWDLEYNRVVRSYHGHLSAVHGISVHPTLDVLFTCGRDATVRVWDMRTKQQVHCLTGHTNTTASVVSRAVDPQVISGSHDSTVRLWDLAAGRSIVQLTNHKKSVRALALHPKESTLLSGAADNLKQWYLPDGRFIQNLSGHSAIINAVAVNSDDIAVSGADNGSLCFWDYRTGHCFQRAQTLPQPGSLDAEAGIYGMTFDRSGSRLITVEADKTIKIYKEDPDSTEERDPVVWHPDLLKKARF